MDAGITEIADGEVEVVVNDVRIGVMVNGTSGKYEMV